MSVEVRHPGDSALGELEALRREVERLHAIASMDRGLLDAVLDHSPHGVIVSDASGKLVLQNRAAERIWAGSASADNVEAWGRYRGFHADGRAFAGDDWAMAQCLRDRVVVEAREVRIQRFDDSFATLVASSAPIFGPGGRLEGAIAVFADISKLKDAEAALQASEHRHSQILDSLSAMVYCKTSDSRVVFANRAARAYYTLGEIDPRRRDNSDVYEQGRTVEVLAEPYTDASGEVRYFDVVKSPLFDRHGKVVQVIGVARDVTERRRAARRLTAHHAMTAVLADASSQAAAVPRILEALAVALEWEFAGWWEVTADRAHLACSALWRAPTLIDADDFEAMTRTLRFARGEGLPGQVWAEGVPLWMQDLRTAPPIPRSQAADQAGLHGAFAFPVLVGTRVVGVIDFFSRRAQAPDEELLHMVRALGHQLGQFVERTRAQQAVAESEAAKAAVLAAALDCIVVMGEDGTVLEWNPAAVQVFGYRRDEALGRDMAELIVPERHREAHRRGLARYLATGEGPMLDKRLELAAIRKDGSEFPVELAITAVHAGERRFFTGYLRDISERRRTWEMQRFLLEASKELASSLEYEATLRRVARLAVPALADWCVIDIVETDGSLRRVEVAHSDPTLELEALEWQSQHPANPGADGGVHQVVRSGQPLVVPEISASTLAAAASNAAHLALLQKISIRSYMIVPLRARGRIVGAISLIAAESNLRYSDADLPVAEELARRAAIAVDNARLFKEREELIHSLERSNADLDAFAHVTSHDLKAPLRGIASLAQWLEEDMEGKLSDQARHYLALLRGRVDRLAGLIEGVLSYSRAGRQKGTREPVDVAELLRDTIALLAPPTHVRITLAEPLPALQTARVPLQQVFLNLLGNAVKHGTRPGAPLLVRVEARVHDDFCEFAVVDDGPGISAEFHERIWEMFQTLQPRDRVESTGIGLSVVRKIVEQRGGRAWVESTPGAGATFRFTWPRIDRTPSH